MLKMANIMKKDQSEILVTAQKALRGVLEKVSFLKVKSIELERNGVDIMATLALDDKKQVLLVELKNNGQPRLARDAVNQLIRYRSSTSYATPVFFDLCHCFFI